jgi:hypothetical protein
LYKALFGAFPIAKESVLFNANCINSKYYS